MKKLIFIFSVTLLNWGCSNQKPVEKTVIGLFTPYSYFPETINKKVREVKETNYLPVEKNGKIEAGNPLTAADKDSINWTNDFIVRFNELGLAEKVTDLNEKGEATGTWDIKTELGYYISAKRVVKDSVIVMNKITHQNGQNYRIEVLDPVLDTLRNKLEIEFNADKKYGSLQWFNYKGIPTFKYNYSYDPEGNLSGYEVSRNDSIRGGMNFTHNEKGFVKTQETFSKIRGTSELFSYEYEYDEAGNWIKCIAYTNNKPYVVGLREYTYY